MDLLSRLSNSSYIIWKGLLFCKIFLYPVIFLMVCKRHLFLIHTFLLTQTIQFYQKQKLPSDSYYIKFLFEACIVCLYALILDLVNFQPRGLYVCQHCISFALWHLIDQMDPYPSVLRLQLYLYSSLKLI